MNAPDALGGVAVTGAARGIGLAVARRFAGIGTCGVVPDVDGMAGTAHRAGGTSP